MPFRGSTLLFAAFLLGVVIPIRLTLAPLFAGWQFAHTAWHFYVIGFFLGIAGASFAVALPLASRWYPAEYQGLAMGIAGAGNSGTLLATLFVPRLAEHYGWPTAFAIAMLPVAAVFVIFALMAKDSPAPRPITGWRDYRAIVRESDTLWLAFLYSLTFGGFSGFASFLTTFFHEQYHLSRVSAGDFTTVVVVAGSLLRPVGGWLSDRLGGYRLLVFLLAGFAACLLGISGTPPLSVAVTVLFVGMGMLGMGNGAVFQLVPQRFPDRMGIVTGLVGAAGGLGGFFLPTVLGAARDLTGSYATGLLLFAGVFAVGTILLLELGTRWTATWNDRAVERAGVFCYRTAIRSVAGDRAA